MLIREQAFGEAFDPTSWWLAYLDQWIELVAQWREM